MSDSPRPEPEDEKQERTPDENDQRHTKEMSNDDLGLGLDLEVKEQDRWLPIANVARIMKSALPENAKIAKEAKECMQECVSEFISFITSEATEKCHQEKRKTVNGEDIIFAMTSLGFENYAEALKIYLVKYRESLNSRGDQKTGGTAAPSSSAAAAPAGTESFESTTDPSIMAQAEGQPDYPYSQGASAEFQ
ncbi:hypothetical protein ANO11243_038260 [Dothideomycetidae sp. 11243]|nr:hypothetical protein ANO11243_038260 [fungal sp. No.11243]